MKICYLRLCLILAVPWFHFGCDQPKLSRQKQQTEIRRCLGKIEADIVDLTSVQEPLGNMEFVAFRDGMTIEKGALICELLKDGHLNDLEGELAILALTGLSETNYWMVTGEVIKSSVVNRRIELILSPHFYGPGYARAFHDSTASNNLVSLRNLGKSESINNLIEGILRGNAEKQWLAVLDEPDVFGWNPEYLKRYRPKADR